MDKLKIEYLKTDELIPYAKNPRKNDGAVDAVAKSIEEFGFKVPIVIDSENNIICGHTRLKAAKKLKIESVPCVIADDLTEEQIKAFRLADNKVGELAEWDFDLLGEELDGIFDIDMSEFGFDLNFDDDKTTEEIVEDEVPEEVETRCKLGDIWQLGNHRLICGDSTDPAVIDRLMDGVKADMVFTDPPYNINFKDDKGRNIENDNLGSEFKSFINNVFKNCLRIVEKGYIYMCFSQRFITEYLDAMVKNKIDDYDLIIWEKDTAMRLGKDYRNYYEPIWLYRINKPEFYGKREYEKNIWHINSIHSAKSKDDFGNSWFKGGNKNLTLHPTQKPVEVPAKAIKNSSNKNDNVLDLFGGSGSTLIACEQLNRKCYMAELDPKYVSVILQRYINFKGSDEDVFLLKDGKKIPYSEVE